MIKLENYEVVGWEHALRGMRNPKNSWDMGDSYVSMCDSMPCDDCPYRLHGNPEDEMGESYCKASESHFLYDTIACIGPNDRKLAMSLAEGGPVHAKYRRMITVYVDITAPLYWWKEFDTYKVGTVANSCSTMHKLTEKEFTLEDFSCDHLIDDPIYVHDGLDTDEERVFATGLLNDTIYCLNVFRKKFLETKDKKYWWQMIQLLPSSYNQKRTVMLNYEVLTNIYRWRKDHKLDCWREFCTWITKLPYSELITGGFDD